MKIMGYLCVSLQVRESEHILRYYYLVGDQNYKSTMRIYILKDVFPKAISPVQKCPLFRMKRYFCDASDRTNGRFKSNEKEILS